MNDRRLMVATAVTTIVAARTSLRGDLAELSVEIAGAFAQTRNRGSLGFVKDHEEGPQDKDHHRADGSHVPGELEKADFDPGDLFVEAEGDRAAGGAEQGDDAAGAGDIGHSHEEPLAEVGRLIALVVETVDGNEQRKDGGGDGGVGHDQGQDRGHDEAAEIDHARLLADECQHLVGETLGQPGLGEDHPDDDGAEDEPHRRMEELLHGEFGPADGIGLTDKELVRPNQEERLSHCDGNACHADGHHLEDPPHRSEEEQGQRRLALFREGEGFTHGVDGCRPGGREVNGEEQTETEQEEEEPLGVDGGRWFLEQAEPGVLGCCGVRHRCRPSRSRFLSRRRAP